MDTIKKFFKKNFEQLNLSIIVLMLFLACFSDAFAYVLMVYIFIVSFFLKTEQIFKMQILLSSFQVVMIVVDAILITYIFVFAYLKNWIIEVFVKKQKVNWKPLVMIFLVGIYYLAFSIYKTKMFDLFYICFEMLIVYFIYESRKELSFSSIAKTFCYGLIISCFLGLFVPEFDKRLIASMPPSYVNGLLRFSGLFFHANMLADHAMMSLAILLALKLYDKISLPEFLVLFLSTFVFAYMTLSRTFLLVFVITFLIFSVIYAKKHKAEGFKFVLQVLAILLSLCLIMARQTSTYIYRVNNQIESEGYSMAKDFLEFYSPTHPWWKQVLNGEIKFDPNRLGLWRIYLYRIFETPCSFMFGYGISSPLIGQTHAHNICLNDVYQKGLVGLILEVLFVLSMVNFKELKNYKKYLGSFLLIVSYYGVLLLNSNTLDVAMVMMIIVSFASAFKDKDKKTSQFEARAKMMKIIKRT